ncbi:MAG: FKBP-type peptidyl-prolyl cis-trans isomerase [Methylotenera sp.]|nr:FKBP-type peptidyl-prolyl cis-trans isomerase [Oligoflexia bacterium]
MKTQIVSFHCVLKNKLGNLISSTFNQDVLTQNSVEDPGELLVGLAKGLQNLHKGEKRRICLSADQAYGFYDPKLVIELSRSEIAQGKHLKLGQEVKAHAENGEMKVFRVTHVHGNALTLDANHPLAGQDLVFDIEATEARDATPEDLLEPEVRPTTTLKYVH